MKILSVLYVGFHYNVYLLSMIFSLTFPGHGVKQRTPFTPLAVRVHLVTGSNLNMVEVASQGVKYHDWTLLRVKLS